MKVHICSRARAKKLSYKFPYAPIVSISDPNSKVPFFNNQPNRRIWRGRFFDIDWSEPDGPTNAHILDILDFTSHLEWGSDTQQLIVHCEAGICRSSATALAIVAMHENPQAAQERFQDLEGIILPNMHMVELFDASIGLSGALVKVGKHFDTKWAEKRLSGD